MNTKEKELIKLQKIWYAKLKTEGFEDIEQLDGNLKAWSNTKFSLKFDLVRFEAKQEYYRLAGAFLQTYPFKTKTDQKIWELHSNGVSIRNIVKKIKSINRAIDANKVIVKIHKFAELMKKPENEQK